MSATPLLKVENLSIGFGGVQALSGVSFDLHAGEIFSILGPNGAGKTTLFNCINGIYTPDTGKVFLEGRDITGVKPDKAARLGIARTFQNIELFSHMTTMDNVLLGRHLHMKTGVLRSVFCGPGVRREEVAAREKAEEVIDFLEIQSARDQLVINLAYGIRKLVELARALALEPKVVLLDEPASGMNLEERQDMTHWIKDIQEELRITCLLVEHDMNLVMGVSDRVLVLNFGQVIALGTPEEIAKDPEVARAYLGREETQEAADA
jgi:branched-chain amino acid transport system ATP-binding protein